MSSDTGLGDPCHDGVVIGVMEAGYVYCEALEAALNPGEFEP